MAEQNRNNEESITMAEKAADQLFDNDEYIYEPEDRQTARAAVLRLKTRFAEVPRVIADALEGALNSGELISIDRLQGLAEILQNADDANASRVRLVLEEDCLVVGHNGDLVKLRHVVGLATPWLSTKGGEADLFGRHGIGLSALRSLSKTIEVHCNPYHLRLGDPLLSPIEPMELPAAFDEEECTIFRIPVSDGSLELDELVEWLDRWGSKGLLFLRNVEEVELREPGGQTIRRLSIRRALESEQVLEAPMGAVVHRQLLEATSDLSWMVYTADVESPKGVSRVRKATEPTTLIGVALPLHEVTTGLVYAGLPVAETPLPVFVNAQFDPLTSRGDLADTEWNRALVPFVAKIWACAAVDLFLRHPEIAWLAMPSGMSREPEAKSLIDKLNDAILDSTRTNVAKEVAFKVSGKGWLKLRELAVESEPLERVVTEEETATLLSMRATLPLSTRDAGGRWRSVLDDWRASGADITEELSVEQALELLQDETRSVRSTIKLSATGLRHGLDDLLDTLPCAVLSDEQRMVPPSGGVAEALAEKVSPLAEELGIFSVLHSAYFEDSKDARLVVQWLRDQGALLDGTDDAAVVHRLAQAGRLGRQLTHPLTHSQADALRRAFELIDVAKRRNLGRAVGHAISLAAYVYQPGGKKIRKPMIASPPMAYQPRSIVRGKDSFALAAGTTSGLVWLDNSYGKTLKSTEGRDGIGAQRFLTLLGAETAPRPENHPQLEERFSGKRVGLHRNADCSPSGRSAALLDLDATYTLMDFDCPSMTRVVEDIARVRQPAKRRKRARALLSTIARAWGRLSDFSEVEAAEDFYDWIPKGRIAAFWLWEARDIAWLDDESGTPRQPSELRIRTSGTEAIFGSESKDFLHRDLVGTHLEQRNRQAVLSALGMSGNPTRRELVARLRELREIDFDERIKLNAAVVYRALAESLDRSDSRSDLTKLDLRRAFDEGEGLIATNQGWRPRSKVYAGPPVFGGYMEFAPLVPGADKLWNALKLRKPSLTDCIKVLRLIARGQSEPDLADEVVQLESLRLLAKQYSESSSREIYRKLKNLPLWTSKGWRRARPVFATDDESLLDVLGKNLPFWKPGGEIEQFQSLLEPLGIELIRSADAEVLEVGESVEDSEATYIYREAVQQLREDLLRNEPEAAKSFRGWDDLSDCAVWVCPELKVAVRVPKSAGGETHCCSVYVKVDMEGRRILVKDPQTDLSRADRGGRAVAALFDGERRRVAQAWSAAWDRAGDGNLATRLELAEQRAEREEALLKEVMGQKLEALQERSRGKRKTTVGNGRSGSEVSHEGDRDASGSKGVDVSNETKPRVLVNPEMLMVTDSSGQVVEGSTAKRGTHPRPSVELADPSGMRHHKPRSSLPLRGYSDQDRENVGFRLAEKVLSSDDEEIVDLRAERGVGADAMDELGQFFELKVSAGGEPNEVTLTSAEWQRAKCSPDFFLVIVSGVEGVDSRPTLRVIPNPLDQLDEKPSSAVKLSGVRDVSTSLTFTFAPIEAMTDNEKVGSDSKE